MAGRSGAPSLLIFGRTASRGRGWRPMRGEHVSRLVMSSPLSRSYAAPFGGSTQWRSKRLKKSAWTNEHLGRTGTTLAHPGMRAKGYHRYRQRDIRCCLAALPRGRRAGTDLSHRSTPLRNIRAGAIRARSSGGTFACREARPTMGGVSSALKKTGARAGRIFPSLFRPRVSKAVRDSCAPR